MKKTKRILSLLLVLCLLFSIMPTTALAANNSMPFTDVSHSDWFYEAIEYVYQHGLMAGTSADNSTFSPGMSITRGMIVTILHRMEGCPSAVGKSFPDVEEGKYYTEAVAWASANQIISGYDNGNFGPNDPITLEQLITILYHYAQYKGYNTAIKGDISNFSDSRKASSYAVDALKWAVGTGLVSGDDNNALNPISIVTRAQAAVILMRFCETFQASTAEKPENEEASSGNTDSGSSTNSDTTVNVRPTFTPNNPSIEPDQPDDDDPIVPVPPVQDGYTLRLKFVDEMDERVLPLTELFAPDITDTALGNKYNGSHIRLTNGENETFDVGDFLNKANDDLSDGMYILGDEIIFTGLEASEEYYVWFDAWSDQYVLPNYEYRFRVPELVENGGQLIPSDETEVVGTIRLKKEYLTVGDTVVTSTNAADIFGDGTANYSFVTNTLTLINAEISAEKPIYYYGNKELNIIIPSGTSSNLSCSQVLGTVVYSYNSISISGGGSLYLDSSATFSGFMSNNEYCIFGYYGVEVSGISLTLGNANYGVASEKADVRLENCTIDIGIPGPNVMFYTRKNGQSIIIRNCDVKNYNFNLYSVISVSSSNVSLYDSTILAYGESNIMSAKKLIIQGGKITLKAYEESIGEDGTIAFELISALESITLMNGITIIKPENGLVVNSTDGHYSIRCVDGAYPTEIIID